MAAIIAHLKRYWWIYLLIILLALVFYFFVFSGSSFLKPDAPVNDAYIEGNVDMTAEQLAALEELNRQKTEHARQELEGKISVSRKAAYEAANSAMQQKLSADIARWRKNGDTDPQIRSWLKDHWGFDKPEGSTQNVPAWNKAYDDAFKSMLGDNFNAAFKFAPSLVDLGLQDQEFNVWPSYWKGQAVSDSFWG